MARARRAEDKSVSHELDSERRAYLRNIYVATRRRSRTQKILLLIAGAIALVFLVDAIYVIVGLRRELTDSRSALLSAKAELRDANATKARVLFKDAFDGAQRAEKYLSHPSISVARVIPWIERDADAVSAIPPAIKLMSQAGLEAIRGAIRLGGTTSEALAGSLLQEGRVRVEILQAAAPYVARSNALLRGAQAQLEGLPTPTFLGLAEALDEARAQVDEAAETATRGEILLETLPPLMGADKPRTYLLAFQSPSESRGTGGIIGLYGTLEAKRGKVRLTSVGPFVELFTSLDRSGITSLEAAQAFIARYEQALEEASDINQSADFEEVSKILLRVYRASTGRSLDGVLATDPLVLGYITGATRPVRGPGIDVEIGPDNAADVLLRQAYVEFRDDPIAQDRFLRGVISNFYDTIASGQVNPTRMLEAFGQSLRSQHLKLFTRDQQEQEGLRELSATGEFSALSSNTQFIYHNNTGANKVDYYFRRKLSTTLRITTDGYVQVRTSIELKNEASRSMDPAIIESYTGAAQPAVNSMELNAVVPKGSRRLSLQLPGGTLDAATGTEGGRPSIWADVAVPPRSSRTVLLNYVIPNATDVLGGGDFTFALFPPSTVTPDRVNVTIIPPAGFQVTTTLPEAEQVGRGRISVSTALDRPLTIALNLEPL